jgi:hypothetical protein
LVDCCAAVARTPPDRPTPPGLDDKPGGGVVNEIRIRGGQGFAGDGRSGGAPVQASSGARVGYLHKRSNWVACQHVGGRVDYGGHFNNVWAWTLTDGTPARGRVNAVYATGGADNGPYGGGVPACAGAHGAPPGGGAGAAPPPPGGAPPPPAPPAAPRPGPSTAAKSGCDDVREDQHARLPFKYTREQYTFDKSQVPAKPFHERHRTSDVGSLTLGVATCRTGKSWRILKPVSVDCDSKASTRFRSSTSWATAGHGAGGSA